MGCWCVGLGCLPLGHYCIIEKRIQRAVVVVSVVVLRSPYSGQMCNTLIGRAMDMLAGGEIFRLIEQEQQREAVSLLETALKVTLTCSSRKTEA